MNETANIILGVLFVIGLVIGIIALSTVYQEQYTPKPCMSTCDMVENETQEWRDSCYLKCTNKFIEEWKKNK